MLRGGRHIRSALANQVKPSRAFSRSIPHQVVLLRGDGIGPEIVDSSVEIIQAAGVEIQWKEYDYGYNVFQRNGTFCSEEMYDTFDQTGLMLKGPITIPSGDSAYAHVRGKTFTSPNQAIRKLFALYANVRPSKSIPGVSKFSDVDLVVIRENTECLYSGIEDWLDDDTVIAHRKISRKACEKISRFAFQYAEKNARNRVTAVHKANVLKKSDGLFLNVFDAIAQEYPLLKNDKHLADSLLTAMVINPQEFDVLVCPNLFGDLVSDLAGGLVGSLGLCPSALIGDNHAVFEPAHGSAPDIAGQDVVNPSSQIFCSVMLLNHIGETDAADRIERSTLEVLKSGKARTKDLGGDATTREFVKAVISQI